jgi:glycosyltransferase involved in cell wall biosynthesis
VLEAFAAGTPVIGSNLGGIAELVRHEVDGLLVQPASSPAAWAEALRRVCQDPSLLASLRAGIRAPRHTRQVAAEMKSLCEEIIHRREVAPVHQNSGQCDMSDVAQPENLNYLRKT